MKTTGWTGVLALICVLGAGCKGESAPESASASQAEPKPGQPAESAVTESPPAASEGGEAGAATNTKTKPDLGDYEPTGRPKVITPEATPGPDGRPVAAVELEKARAEIEAKRKVMVEEAKKYVDPPKSFTEAPAGTPKSANGLYYQILIPGKGVKKPLIGAHAHVHFAAWNHKGDLFDSSYGWQMPMMVRVGAATRGWTEMLLEMTAGEKRRLWVPKDYPFDPHEARTVDASTIEGMIVFDVELLTYENPVDISAPPHVDKAPDEAKKLPTGLAYLELDAGYLKERPTKTSRVLVHYTGWKSDGTVIDDTRTAGQPLRVHLPSVIKGWQQILPMMNVGDRWRIWIPAELAYGTQSDDPKIPTGDLVYDIYLMKVLEE